MLAAILRPGSAGANNAADHLDLFELALEQLPREALDGPILARSDSAGASHALADACRETAVRFSFGYAINERVRDAILALPEAAWRPAIDGDNQPRDGAWVAELTDHRALDAWPEGSRLIVRRERPHPGAQTPVTGRVARVWAVTSDRCGWFSGWRRADSRRLCRVPGSDRPSLCRPPPPEDLRRDLIGAWHRPE